MKACDGTQQGRCAAPVGSEHSDDLAGRHRQAGGAELPALVIIGMMGRLSPLWRSAMRCSPPMARRKTSALASDRHL